MLTKSIQYVCLIKVAWNDWIAALNQELTDGKIWKQCYDRIFEASGKKPLRNLHRFANGVFMSVFTAVRNFVLSGYVREGQWIAFAQSSFISESPGKMQTQTVLDDLQYEIHAGTIQTHTAQRRNHLLFNLTLKEQYILLYMWNICLCLYLSPCPLHICHFKLYCCSCRFSVF